MAMQYKDPANGVPSNIGSQARTDFFKTRAMIEVQDDIFFGQFSDTMQQPKNSGKKVIMDHYLPVLHDANLNDQGIDATGVSTVQKVTIKIVAGTVPADAMDYRGTSVGGSYGTYYAVGEGATAGTALTAAQAKAVDVFKTLGVFVTSYAATKTAVLALTPAWTVTEGAAVPATGNLYGSSRDVGLVQGKLPTLGENGGRVNRVGNTRVRLESSIERLGFFDEYTADSLDFDSDSELEMHTHREMLRAAVEIAEDALQLDILAAAGLIRFGGTATSTSQLTGETSATASLVTYDDLMRLDIDLTNNRAPKTISAITGSTNVDTLTVQGARPLLIGSEMIPTIKAMTDNFGNQAFKDISKYSAAGSKAVTGEIGAIDGFRIIVVPRMMYWAGVGATVTNNAGYRATNGKYDVFPLLCISKGAFTEIGFRSSNANAGKWDVKHQKPGMATMAYNDPFGMTGRRSISFWYGCLVQRPEWIGLIKSVAKL